jgi:hypothetical protein
VVAASEAERSPQAFSGKVDTGYPSENATTDKAGAFSISPNRKLR